MGSVSIGEPHRPDLSLLQSLTASASFLPCSNEGNGAVKIGILPFFESGFIDNPDWVKPFLQTVERAGVESVWQVEHPIVAEDYEPLYSYSADGQAPFRPETVMPDPLEWLGYAAGVTETLKLGTGVLLLPLHSPIIIAKRIATLDSLARGRVLLGVGMGWQKEEYAAVNVPYGERGKRLDEGIEAVRILWRDQIASYDGQYYQFHRVHSDPKPAKPSGVPILIGGSTDVAARRAARLGDGFFPHAISPDDFGLRLETMRKEAQAIGRDPSEIELTVSPASWKHGGSLDIGVLRAYAQLGVARFIISSYEAEGREPADIERLVMRHRDLLASL
jgi:probable F420-dependent oxidoreductase